MSSSYYCVSNCFILEVSIIQLIPIFLVQLSSALTKSITNGYQTGGLYGRLLELKDLQLYTQKRINEIQKEIDELPNGQR